MRLRRPQLAATLAVLLALTPPTDSRARRRAAQSASPPSRRKPSHEFVAGLPPGCGGRQSSNADIFDFFNDAAHGKKTRADIEEQADWIFTDLELGCTPRMVRASRLRFGVRSG